MRGLFYYHYNSNTGIFWYSVAFLLNHNRHQTSIELKRRTGPQKTC